MTSDGPLLIASAANALLKDLKRLAQDTTAYRKQERIWVEGDHLCRAALERGVQPMLAVYQASFWRDQAPAWQAHAARNVVVDDALYASLSSLESPSRMGFVVPLPPQKSALQAGVATVVLDNLQDPGNAGSILRSAAAFGFRQVVAMKGTAALWSPKVLRSGMGAHFSLNLVESAQVADVLSLGVPLVATSSHRGDYLHESKLPSPCAWLFGHEGQGVSHALADAAAMSVRIMQPGGEESLNVASAAAICLHASATSR